MSQSTIFRRVLFSIGRGPCTLVKRTWKTALALVLILAVAHGIATFVTGRMVDAEIAKIKAKGEIASLAEIAGPKVPDDENAAVVYAKAFEFVKDKSAESSMETLYSLQGDHAESWDKIRKAVSRFDGVMPLLEQAAARPKCQFPVKWQQFDASFEHPQRLRQLQHYLSAKAMLTARDGNLADALHLVRLQLDLSESLREEPAIISQLVRVELIGVAYDSLRDCLKHGSVDLRQARQLCATLSGIDLIPGCSKTIEVERIVIGIAGFEYIRKNPGDLGIPPPSWSTPIWLLCERSFLGRPIMNVDQLVYFRTMAKVVASSRKPYRELGEKWGGRFYGIGIPSYAPVSGLIITAISGCMEARDEAEAKIALAQVALGLCVYRKSYGEYPASLDLLKTRLNWTLPEDPFTGKRLIYRRQGDSFVLYSIGMNLEDDGGKEAQYKEEGDIVWLPAGG